MIYSLFIVYSIHGNKDWAIIFQSPRPEQLHKDYVNYNIFWPMAQAYS